MGQTPRTGLRPVSCHRRLFSPLCQARKGFPSIAFAQTQMVRIQRTPNAPPWIPGRGAVARIHPRQPSAHQRGYVQEGPTTNHSAATAYQRDLLPRDAIFLKGTSEKIRTVHRCSIQGMVSTSNSRCLLALCHGQFKIPHHATKICVIDENLNPDVFFSLLRRQLHQCDSQRIHFSCKVSRGGELREAQVWRIRDTARLGSIAWWTAWFQLCFYPFVRWSAAKHFHLGQTLSKSPSTKPTATASARRKRPLPALGRSRYTDTRRLAASRTSSQLPPASDSGRDSGSTSGRKDSSHAQSASSSLYRSDPMTSTHHGSARLKLKATTDDGMC
jgi:hypothetical protein